LESDNFEARDFDKYLESNDKKFQFIANQNSDDSSDDLDGLEPLPLVLKFSDDSGDQSLDIKPLPLVLKFSDASDDQSVDSLILEPPTLHGRASDLKNLDWADLDDFS
jgi:hypothetical protein